MYQGNKTLTINNGTAVTAEAFQLPQDQALVGIAMPAAWTAAVLTFSVSYDAGATWSEVVKADGTAYTLTVAAAQTVMVPFYDLLGIPYWALLRVRSGTLGTPVNQAAARTLTLILHGEPSR